MELSILYVEDERSIRQEMLPFLERFATGGLFVASDGEEGLELFETRRPDLVISDIVMPRMNGVEMVRKIRGINSDQPVLLATANSDSEFLIETIELGVDGYIPKPVDLDLLATKIMRISDALQLKREFAHTQTILDEIARFRGNFLAVLDERFRPIFLNERMRLLTGVDCKLPEEREGEGYRRFWKALLPLGSAAIVEEALLHEFVETLDRDDFLDLEHGGEERIFKADVERVEESGHTILSLTEVTRMMQERRHYEEKAYHDELTGLKNRFGFNHSALESIFFAGERGLPLSLIVFDADHFKGINDRYGHLIGDEVLVEMARLLQEQTPKGGVIARWGGEEFALLLPGFGLAQGRELAEKILNQIRNRRWSRYAISVTCSAGVSECEGRGETPETLFERADKALYLAKKAGRDRAECL